MSPDFLLPDPDFLPQRSPHHIRLLTYNIQVGMASRSFHDYVTKFWKHLLPHKHIHTNLATIADAISQFDIVALQEVDAGSFRSGFVNQIEYLAEKGGFPHWYQQTNREIGFITKHSNGLLSKFDPYEVSHYKLPGPIPGRGAMVVRYGDPSNPLILIIAHLALGRRARSRQLEFISEILNCYQHVILMGDLNCQPDSSEMKKLMDTTNLLEPANDLKTFPSWRPSKSFDHILASPGLIIRDIQVLDHHQMSDHLPIAVDLQLPESFRFAA